MTNEVKVFQNQEFGAVRTMERDGEPWFVGKDVAEILGYSNPNEAISDHVDEEDKLNSKMLSSLEMKLGQRGGWLINESGLYSLILYSKLPKAKQFKRWVTSEVLPAIRRHGVYAMDELLKDPDMLIAALTELKNERQRVQTLQLENKVQSQQIAELQPKASYYDLVLQCKDLLSMTEIAKDYGKSAKAMNALLHDLGVQYRQGGVWFLYAKYQDRGYTQTKTQNYPKPDGTQGAKVHTYWTQKGRLFIYDLLKNEGILPLIEQGEAA